MKEAKPNNNEGNKNETKNKNKGNDTASLHTSLAFVPYTCGASCFDECEDYGRPHFYSDIGE